MRYIAIQTSNKLKTITNIRNTIMQIMNDSQDIKRLIYYISVDPLNEMSVDLEGNFITQPNLDIDFIIGDKRILPFFNKGILTEEKVYIVCHRYSSDLKDDVIGLNKIIIDIFVPQVYSQLDSDYDRQILIATLICDNLDREIIKSKSLGKIKVVSCQESITDTDKEFTVLSMFLEIPTSNMKL